MTAAEKTIRDCPSGSLAPSGETADIESRLQRVAQRAYNGAVPEWVADDIAQTCGAAAGEILHLKDAIEASDRALLAWVDDEGAETWGSDYAGQRRRNSYAGVIAAARDRAKARGNQPPATSTADTGSTGSETEPVQTKAGE